jgi:hypothetical protein
MDQVRPAPLGNYGSNGGIPGQGLDTSVWPLMRWLWANSCLEGLQKCHRVRYGPNVEVFVSASGGVFYGGFCRCHSVWACPMCATVIRSGRAREMGGGLKVLIGAGGGCVFSTYTLPHDVGDGLARLFDAVAWCWKQVRDDRAVKAVRRRLGLEFSRSTEVTYGAHGFHPHLHVGEVCERPLTRDEILEYRGACFSAWCRAVQVAGYRPPSDRYGLTMVRADAGMAEYANKVEGLASELFRQDRKSGKTESPFAILRRAVAGDVRAAAVWGEYERVTKNRRMLGQSRGFKRVCKYDEASEAELLDPKSSDGLVYVGTLRPEGAHLLVNHPQGFEGFAEMVGPGTPEAWQAACLWLTGTAPLYLTERGWEEIAEEFFAQEAAPVYGSGSTALELF